MNKAKGPILINQNVKEIVGDDKVRATKCAQAVNTMLERYDCVVIPQIMLTPGQMPAGKIEIIAKPRTGGDNHG